MRDSALTIGRTLAVAFDHGEVTDPPARARLYGVPLLASVTDAEPRTLSRELVRRRVRAAAAT